MPPPLPPPPHTHTQPYILKFEQISSAVTLKVRENLRKSALCPNVGSMQIWLKLKNTSLIYWFTFLHMIHGNFSVKELVVQPPINGVPFPNYLKLVLFSEKTDAPPPHTHTHTKTYMLKFEQISSANIESEKM